VFDRLNATKRAAKAIAAFLKAKSALDEKYARDLKKTLLAHAHLMDLAPNLSTCWTELVDQFDVMSNVLLFSAAKATDIADLFNNIRNNLKAGKADVSLVS
jgi:hypothetical protein